VNRHPARAGVLGLPTVANLCTVRYQAPRRWGALQMDQQQFMTQLNEDLGLLIAA